MNKKNTFTFITLEGAIIKNYSYLKTKNLIIKILLLRKLQVF